jgi:hypothetical protein
MKHLIKLLNVMVFAICVLSLGGAGMALAADVATAPAAAGGSMLDIIFANKSVILAALLAVSEALALIPGIKANSVFQLVVNGLGAMASQGTPPAKRR